MPEVVITDETLGKADVEAAIFETDGAVEVFSTTAETFEVSTDVAPGDDRVVIPVKLVAFFSSASLFVVGEHIIVHAWKTLRAPSQRSSKTDKISFDLLFLKRRMHF